jgi:hypothetical protein
VSGAGLSVYVWTIEIRNKERRYNSNTVYLVHKDMIVYPEELKPL